MLGVVKSHEVSSFIGNLFFPLPAYHWGMLRGEASISIKALHRTGVARLVSRGMIVLQRPRQVSLIVRPTASKSTKVSAKKPAAAKEKTSNSPSAGKGLPRNLEESGSFRRRT
jgi:hypothetical protein